MWDGRRETRHIEKNKVKLYLGLGSNQGDRQLNIEHAVAMLNVELKTPYRAISSLIETEPWGFESQQKFMNAVVLYELDLPQGYNPEAEGLMILEICKLIKEQFPRGNIVDGIQTFRQVASHAQQQSNGAPFGAGSPCFARLCAHIGQRGGHEQH